MSHAPDAPDRYRPRVHYATKSTWLNDPNGLIHHDGLWHLFHQANPEGDVWGSMSWGHATSTDLVHWTEHPVALRYTDEEHIFSGSVVCDHDGRSPFGAGALVAFHTSDYQPGSPRHRTQAQSVAVSVDGGYSWSSYARNPVVDRGSSDFRDPKVFAHDGGWVMIAVEAVERRVVLYRSENLVDWRYLSTWTAPDAPLVTPEGSAATCWECPDLFPLELDGERHWVLLVSLNPGGAHGGSAGLAYVGEFDGTQFTEHPRPVGAQPWLDHGRDCYATVTFNDAPGGRRVAIGWMSNWDYAREAPTHGGRGALTLPRELSLARRGARVVVVQQPVPELSASLPAPATAPDLVAEPSAQLPVPPEAVVLRMRLRPEADDVYLDLDGARLGYREGRLYLDRTDSGAVDFHPTFASVESVEVPLVSGALDLLVVRDSCSLEVFADDGAVTLTDLVFPTSRSPITLSAAGGRAELTGLEWQ